MPSDAEKTVKNPERHGFRVGRQALFVCIF